MLPTLEKLRKAGLLKKGTHHFKSAMDGKICTYTGEYNKDDHVCGRGTAKNELCNVEKCALDDQQYCFCKYKEG